MNKEGGEHAAGAFPFSQLEDQALSQRPWVQMIFSAAETWNSLGVHIIDRALMFYFSLCKSHQIIFNYIYKTY
jgi:hypothetical protein